MTDAVVARAAPQPTRPAAPAGAPGAAPAGPAIAIVNGQPIAYEAWFNLLKRAHGLGAFQQVLALELARQAAQAKGITLTREQLDQAVQHDIVEVVGPEVQDPAERQRILDAILVRRGVSMDEFSLSAHRNAYLRAIVEPIVERSITPEALQGEFDRLYGTKVQVRHIQLALGGDPARVLRALADGMAFSEAAAKFSQNIDTGPAGGLLPPFSRSDPAVPAPLREAAFGVKPGEVIGPIRAEGFSHILKVESVLPAEQVEYPRAAEKVRRSLQDQLIRQETQRMLQDMLRSATIQVHDKDLGEQLEALRKARP